MWSTPELPDPSLRRERQQLSQQQQPHGIGAAAEGSTARMMVLPLQTAAAGHGDGDYAHEIAETLRFQEEIQSLMRETLLESQVVHGPVATGVLPTPQPPTSSSSPSFTALLGLPTSQAMELLHDPGVPPHTTAATLPPPLTAVDFPYPGISPTFPSNAALVERAARYSVFAASEAAAAGNAEGSPDSSSLQPSNSSDSARAVKPEPADSDSRSEQQQMALSPSPPPLPHQRGGKRKEPEKNKGKPGNGGKKNKGAGEDGATKVEAEDKQQLPYVHVRARRGQATDSHSLAERARREKINARMKLLQELVPGCSKISGTALVLDEIINHVQCLQRQVELLSMRLAAVNPSIDFGGLDSFLTTEQPVRVPGSAVGMDAAAAAAPPVLWAEVPVDDLSNRLRHHHNQQNQIWQGDSAGPHPSPSVLWSGDSGHHQLYLHHHHHHGGLIGPGTSLFGYDSASVVPLHASQLKTEL